MRFGECFRFHRAGPIAIRPLSRASLRLDWPSEAPERLPPGLEPIEL